MEEKKRATIFIKRGWQMILTTQGDYKISLVNSKNIRIKTFKNNPYILFFAGLI